MSFKSFEAFKFWHLQHIASWLFNSPSFLFALQRFERWHLSQVCALSLAEIIAFVFRQAPFPSKGIVSTCCEERIMVSHLVPHPRSFSCTYKHIQTHAPILRRKDWRTRAKLSKHIHSLWLRSLDAQYVHRLRRESPPTSFIPSPSSFSQNCKLTAVFYWLFSTYDLTFELLNPWQCFCSQGKGRMLLLRCPK